MIHLTKTTLNFEMTLDLCMLNLKFVFETQDLSFSL